MNKTTKILATLLACETLTGTCLAAPHGGRHNPGPAPMHHRAPEPPRHHHRPPPPPRHEMHYHHDRHHHDTPGIIAFGAAVVGGIVGGLIGR